MSLVKYNRTPSLFNLFFDDAHMKDVFYNNLNTHGKSKWSPSSNIIENENGFEIEMSVPGFSKNDIQVNLENKFLKISAEHKAENEKETDKIHRREFNFQSFERSFKLPENIDLEKISAKSNNGILRITLPLNTDASANKARSIKIG